MRVITGFLALALLIAACGDDAPGALDSGDEGATVSVSPGGVVTIELESNPSTGFSWVLPEDLGILELSDERWVGDSDLVGSPGITRLEFDVVGVGEFTLVLEYRRPWLPDEPADQTFSVTIVSS